MMEELNKLAAEAASQAISVGANRMFGVLPLAEHTEGIDQIRKVLNAPASEDVMGVICMQVVKGIVPGTGEPGYSIDGGLSGDVDILTGLGLLISNKIAEIRALDNTDDSQSVH